MDGHGLEVDIYQIVDDAMMRSTRCDGTGWDWAWADWRRGWMDATPGRHAYRCLPLTIVNQAGWWVRNPVGFTATWRGTPGPGSIDFRFDASGEDWSGWINNQFGEGIVTWNTPFLFRTRPRGSRLLVCGPPNLFKPNAHPLTALIESDWMTMSFTMNWKIMAAGQPVRFEAGEPLFQAIPLISNPCADLEAATVRFRRLGDDPEMAAAYRDWDGARRQYQESKTKGEVAPDGWQKDYFRGQDASGRPADDGHMTKVRPPKVQREAPGPGPDPASPIGRLAGPEMAEAAGACPRGGSGIAGDRAREGRPREIEPADSTRTEAQASPATGTGAAPAIPGRGVDDEWRRWIAENLMIDAAPGGIVDALVASGFSPEVAAIEVDLALKSPYTRGADLLRNRLRKRDWLLASYRKLNRLGAGSAEVERRHRLPRAEFLDGYYRRNRPVIITGMMDDWPALGRWDLGSLAARFGDREVEVQFGREAGEDYEIERQKYLKTLKFAEFAGLIRGAGVTNDFYMTANNSSRNRASLRELWDEIIPIPEYLDSREGPGGFLWMGPAGTVTPFHHDLTNNLMAQVVGRKRVKIAPSWDLPLMANHRHVFSRVDGRVTPARPVAGPDEAQILECILGPGELLFLPIGCLHFVEGLDVSATVSFTNFAFDNDFASFYSTYDGV